jgi:phospholipid transport system substrate-binding protein
MSVVRLAAFVSSRPAIVLAAFLACCMLPQTAAADDPAVEFMKQVSRELIAAAKSRSPQAFADTVNRHGHVRAIGLYALGNYKQQLQPAERESYYAGMVRFIAKYAASASQTYQVSHAEIFGPAKRTDRGIFVESRVHIKDGSSYDVQWVLMPQGNTFKVRDAQISVLGMQQSAVQSLKDLFEKYIGDNGGRVQALMVALNR